MQLIAHIAVMQKFVYRLAGDALAPEQAARIRLIIQIYKRLYVQG